MVFFERKIVSDREFFFGEKKFEKKPKKNSLLSYLVKLRRGRRPLKRLQQIQQQVQARLCDVALGVPKGPNDSIHEQLELRRTEPKESPESGAGDRAQQREKLEPVLGEVLKVGRDHLQRGPEDRVEAARDDLGGGGGTQLGYYGGIERKRLGVARLGRARAGVGAEDGLGHGGNVLLRQQRHVVAGPDPRLQQPKGCAFGPSQGLHACGASCVRPSIGDSGIGGSGIQSVDPQHVVEASGHLRREGGTQARTHASVCLQDVGDRFDPVRLEQLLSRRVYRQRGRNDGVPGRVRRRHQPFQVSCPLALVGVGTDHQTHRFVKHVHLVRLQVLDRCR